MLHGVPAADGTHWPVLAVHWLETHSVPPHFGVPVHAPAIHISDQSKTHRLPSEQGVPSTTATGVEQSPVDGSHVPGRWHVSGATHVIGFEPMHVPALHWSVWVQRFSSLQAVPSGATGVEQSPVLGSQVPAKWQESDATQAMRFVGWQTPFWQASLTPHAFPSSQIVPFGRGGFEHWPVAGLHVPTAWHWSSAVQTTWAPAVQAPDWQVSFRSQALPSLHTIPFGTVVKLHVPLALHSPVAQVFVQLAAVQAGRHWPALEIGVTGHGPPAIPETLFSVPVPSMKNTFSIGPADDELAQSEAAERCGSIQLGEPNVPAARTTGCADQVVWPLLRLASASSPAASTQKTSWRLPLGETAAMVWKPRSALRVGEMPGAATANDVQVPAAESKCASVNASLEEK
jgi:hypothetical protein